MTAPQHASRTRPGGAVADRGPLRRARGGIAVRHVAWRLGLVVALGLLAVPSLGVGAALGACASTPSIEDAVAHSDVVFVGTVVALDNEDRNATVAVEERWQGAGGLAPTVEVHGGGEPLVESPTDRKFQLGRYLFTVSNGPGYLVDDACTATTPWTGDLAQFRPEGIAPAPGVPNDPTTKDTGFGAALPTGILFGALAIAVIAYLLVLRSRRRPPDWRR